MIVEHPMRKIDIEKVVLNIGVGESGEKLAKAEKLLEKLTNRKPVRTLAKKTIKDWGIKYNEPIGCKVTLRKLYAIEFLKSALWVRQNKLPEYSFDNYGGVAFGIPDYSLLKKIKYDPEIGMFGFDIAVKLKRPGYRIKYRKVESRKISKNHSITKEDAMKFFKDVLGIEILK